MTAFKKLQAIYRVISHLPPSRGSFWLPSYPTMLSPCNILAISCGAGVRGPSRQLSYLDLGIPFTCIPSCLLESAALTLQETEAALWGRAFRGSYGTLSHPRCGPSDWTEICWYSCCWSPSEAAQHCSDTSSLMFPLDGAGGRPTTCWASRHACCQGVGGQCRGCPRPRCLPSGGVSCPQPSPAALLDPAEMSSPPEKLLPFMRVPTSPSLPPPHLWGTRGAPGGHRGCYARAIHS